MLEVKETRKGKARRKKAAMFAFMENGTLLAPMSGAEMIRLRIDIGTALGVYITQEDLGVFINRGVSNVNKFEQGKRPIPQSIGTLLRLVHRVAQLGL